MNKKLPTVTIAVSAYNEQANIAHFLRSVLNQKTSGYVLQEIIVVSDGSEDRTVQIVQKMQRDNQLIRLVVLAERLGKSTHLNRIYKELSSDILVQSDADVRLAHPRVIYDIIQPLLRDDRVGMCGGNPIPAAGRSFWEKMNWVAFEPYLYFRSRVRGGDNAFSAVGQLLAFRKDCVQSITIPADMVTNDLFAYFYSLNAGWKYRYVARAEVLFQAPRKLTDIIRQNTRFHTGHQRMYDYFPEKLVHHELSVPLGDYIRAILKQVVKYPVHSLSYYVVNAYCRILSRIAGNKLNAKWPIATTTKKFVFLSVNL